MTLALASVRILSVLLPIPPRVPFSRVPTRIWRGAVSVTWRLVENFHAKCYGDNFSVIPQSVRHVDMDVGELVMC